jgi:hypothetical protein
MIKAVAVPGAQIIPIGRNPDSSSCYRSAAHAALRAGGIRASTVLCDGWQDGNPRAGASMVRVGSGRWRRARHLGSWWL